MESLPDNLPKLQVQLTHKRSELGEFRRYLAQSDVLKSIVDLLLRMRHENLRPSDAASFVQSYFGEYSDPKWDLMSIWQSQIGAERARTPQLQAEVGQLRAQLATARVTRDALKLFTALDTSKTGLISTKQLVNTLCGFNKFEIDQKLTKERFRDFFNNFLAVGPTEEDIMRGWTLYGEMLTRLTNRSGPDANRPPFPQDDPGVQSFLEKLRAFL
eukprot:CAMPEP_0204898570 /NCGR_PEP_ID=MMETSP1397-20131031/1372_1 /ASSEMBLY_ACC=CAM_ASM_000891 /TAXON_ID=49980 /ORGANISM="Climacostomum Climacostomum virens, Strain Stock W-24" /LENGTH=214 /DNA_ID=CAMNT_0052066445 /DNA_START=267 /DNA_END=907 /DNA_ORIENTATION=+